ncbi:MAG TPA: NIPSNAP family protein [Haliangiales bacterium]|nr:NIPSNAP family protein [Haliangiales bacterium]
MDRVLELRQYTLHPGGRDVLIDLFDREFVEPQEAVGMHVVGQFRDLDDPDRFVWLRGFTDMISRADALAAFYGGPVWQAHRDAANATMVDSDNVLLLRPVYPGAGFPRPRSPRSPLGAGAGERGTSVVAVTIYYAKAAIDAEVRAFFMDSVRREMAAAGAPPLALLETEPAENTFPRLPVRTGEHAIVWATAFDDAGAHRDHVARLARSRGWTERVKPRLDALLVRPPEELRLEPTARSELR